MSKEVETLQRRLRETEDKLSAYEKAHSIKSFKSDYVGCKQCGSKLRISYMRNDICPVCRHDLRSETTLNTIKGYRTKINDLNKKLQIAIRKDNRKNANNQTPVPQSKFKEALSDVYDELDYVMERYDSSDFVEIIGKTGGDVRRIRVYKDGTVGEK